MNSFSRLVWTLNKEIVSFTLFIPIESIKSAIYILFVSLQFNLLIDCVSKVVQRKYFFVYFIYPFDRFYDFEKTGKSLAVKASIASIVPMFFTRDWLASE